MRGPLGEYIRVTALSCKICRRVKYCLHRPLPFNRLWEDDCGSRAELGEVSQVRAGTNTSLRVCMNTDGNICYGLWPGGAGHRTAAPISRHWSMGTAAAQAQLWFEHPWAFMSPCTGEAVLSCFSRMRTSLLHLAGEMLHPPDGRCPSPCLAILISHCMSIP